MGKDTITERPGKAMTDRARKILEGKRERAIGALVDEKRKKDGLVTLRDDEAAVLMKWINELLCHKRIEKTVQAETEGDGKSTWWYVCGECHTAIDRKDHFCRECGARIDWEGFA